MNATLLKQATVVASNYNHSDIWSDESFRFKNAKNIGKSELFLLRNNDLIQKRDDAWTVTTWEWTESGSTAIEMVNTSPLTEASEKQLSALSEHAEILLAFPRTDDFLASEFNLIGQSIQTLSSCDLIEQVDTEGQLGVWSMTDFALRLLTSLEAVSMRVDSGNANNAAIPADD